MFQAEGLTLLTPFKAGWMVGWTPVYHAESDMAGTRGKKETF